MTIKWKYGSRYCSMTYKWSKISHSQGHKELDKRVGLRYQKHERICKYLDTDNYLAAL
ncbi:hypothetical protein K439DRAFT_1633525 [Ramaria rubella]|nr:hypothetical protein K439DRAFT_1633525 [Ramaria rubella]